MAVSIEALGIDRLSVAERLELIEQIWNSLPEQIDPNEVPKWHRAELAKRRRGNGIWRLPNQRDGAERSPTPRFTVLQIQDHMRIKAFALSVAAEFYRVLVPGAHIIWATHPLFSHIVSTAFSDMGF